MLLASLEKKQIRLHANVAPGSYVIKGDQTKLMQVILNVLKNSVEAIDMEADEKHITITLLANNGVIELKVKDNGKGFSAETGAHLFERGFTTKSNGTGLGLYNCRSIIESHAGAFDITSAGIDKGAEITIAFKTDPTE
jgi:nitrogen fixation/metabolism regulation signal transduction histidine kinase